jgi:tetratricopeptide (TPR) repeat protein
MRHLMRPVSIALGLAGLGLSLISAATAQAAIPVDQARYEACLAEIDSDPMAAYETGLAWQAQSGGWPAAHCTALAIIATGDVAEGARRLEVNAEGAVAAGSYARAVMSGRPGDAWLAAGEPAQALRAFTRGRDFAPDDAGLALGRSEAALEAGLYEVAEQAGDDAVALAPQSAEAYRLRGRARLELGALEAAEADMRAARERDPESIEVLLLRGDIVQARRAAG